uniref:family 43 glycosylhydrolase n=1 Tax=Streptomyces cyaneochromogenes TaxID=2496836 RepID=UPI001E62AB88|nr:family 43 glycosylhydrolase [Streptomyces cyaneochromogenes]
MQHSEAPHLCRVGDWRYLMLAEGGTALGHSVSVARARSPRGPYEPAPANPIPSNRPPRGTTSTPRAWRRTGSPRTVGQRTRGR